MAVVEELVRVVLRAQPEADIEPVTLAAFRFDTPTTAKK